MPSLKDLRNRIASVKATQKITKAMQMVAAAKLRRAQEAARRAALCRAHGPRARQPRPASPTGPRRRAAAGRHRQGRGASAGRHDGRARPVRRLQLQHRPSRARSDADRLLRDGKTVKILCVGRKGDDSLRRDFGRQIVDRVDLQGVKQLGFANAPDDRAARCSRMFEAGEFDVATLFFSRVQVGDQPEADGAAADPGRSCRQPRRRRHRQAGRPIYEYEPDEEEILSDLLPRNIAAQIFRGAAGERRLRAGRADERHGQRHAQRRRHDRQADAAATTASARRRSPRN